VEIISLHSLSELLDVVKQYLINGWVLVGGSECVSEFLERLPGREEAADIVIVYKCGYVVHFVMLKRETLKRVLEGKIAPVDLEKLVALELFAKRGECYGRLIGPRDLSERQAFIENLARNIAEYLERDEVERCADLSVI